MFKQEVLRNIRKCKTLYVGVCISDGDIEYVQAVKSNLRLVIEDYDNDVNINAVLREDGDLYIN